MTIATPYGQKSYWFGADVIQNTYNLYNEFVLMEKLSNHKKCECKDRLILNKEYFIR